MDFIQWSLRLHLIFSARDRTSKGASVSISRAKSLSLSLSGCRLRSLVFQYGQIGIGCILRAFDNPAPECFGRGHTFQNQKRDLFCRCQPLKSLPLIDFKKSGVNNHRISRIQYLAGKFRESGIRPFRGFVGINPFADDRMAVCLPVSCQRFFSVRHRSGFELLQSVRESAGSVCFFPMPTCRG